MREVTHMVQPPNDYMLHTITGQKAAGAGTGPAWVGGNRSRDWGWQVLCFAGKIHRFAVLGLAGQACGVGETPPDEVRGPGLERDQGAAPLAGCQITLRYLVYPIAYESLGFPVPHQARWDRAISLKNSP